MASTLAGDGCAPGQFAPENASALRGPRLRELLERVAAKSGRSLVQQAEHMIQSSLRDELLFAALGGSVAGSVIRPILFFLGSLESRVGDWRSDPAIANAMRQAIGLIGEAAFAEAPLSKERQQEFLISFYEARNGDLLPIDGEATDVAILALMAVQGCGLAETMVPLPAASERLGKPLSSQNLNGTKRLLHSGSHGVRLLCANSRH